MPVKSRAEQAYLAIHKPDVLHKLASDSPIPKNLPYHVGDKHAKHRKRKAQHRKQMVMRALNQRSES